MALVLGGIVFKGFEIPEKVPFGGSQHLSIKTMMGGERIIDAMGPVPHRIGWAGIFQGEGALFRARAVDALRISGAQVMLSWGSLAYMVVVESFRPVYEREYQIPYTIDCEPLSSGGDLFPTASLATLVSNDIASALAALA